MDSIFAAFALLAFNLPLYLVWIIGIVVAVRRRSQHPRVSSCVTIGLALLLGVSMCATIFNAMLPQLLANDQLSTAQLGVVLGSVNGLAQLANTAAWVLVLVATFGWRDATMQYRSRA